MTDPNRNARWCRLIAEELRRAGTTHVVLCPGSRNSPLVFALATEFGDGALSHVDERSAGFIAIGLIRATGERAAVCVTSGSALANLLPAVCEADAAELPLIVISADRPWEAHGCAAPQTMPQRGILGAFVRGELPLGEPIDDDKGLRALRMGISRLAQTTNGPVHLNVPLRDPLPPLPDVSWKPVEPSQDALSGRAGAYTARHQPIEAQPVRREEWMRPGLKGVIVVGCLADPHIASSPIYELAESTGFPLLADAASHLRRPGAPNLVTTQDALVGGRFADQRPDLVIQVGQAPLTRAMYEWLDRARCPWISFSGSGNLDMLARATVAIEGGWHGAMRDLSAWLAHGDIAWRDRWLAAEAQARTSLDTHVAGLGWSESLAIHRTLAHTGFRFAHLASSMAVRHANLHAGPADRLMHSNRGVNGIDGTLGTFLGLCHGHRLPGVALVGDLAFLHDLPALAASGLGLGAIVLLNNGGGGIFDYLPVAQVPGYDRWIRTSHQLTFAGAAELFGLPYHAVRNAVELEKALDAALDGRLHLVECHLQGLDSVTQHRALLKACGGLDGNGRAA